MSLVAEGILVYSKVMYLSMNLILVIIYVCVYVCIYTYISHIIMLDTLNIYIFIYRLDLNKAGKNTWKKMTLR